MAMAKERSKRAKAWQRLSLQGWLSLGMCEKTQLTRLKKNSRPSRRTRLLLGRARIWMKSLCQLRCLGALWVALVDWLTRLMPTICRLRKVRFKLLLNQSSRSQLIIKCKTREAKIQEASRAMHQKRRGTKVLSCQKEKHSKVSQQWKSRTLWILKTMLWNLKDYKSIMSEAGTIALTLVQAQVKDLQDRINSHSLPRIRISHQIALG